MKINSIRINLILKKIYVLNNFWILLLIDEDVNSNSNQKQSCIIQIRKKKKKTQKHYPNTPFRFLMSSYVKGNNAKTRGCPTTWESRFDRWSRRGALREAYALREGVLCQLIRSYRGF